MLMFVKEQADGADVGGGRLSTRAQFRETVPFFKQSGETKL